jgi:hypothetical protein
LYPVDLSLALGDLQNIANIHHLAAILPEQLIENLARVSISPPSYLVRAIKIQRSEMNHLTRRGTR